MLTLQHTILKKIASANPSIIVCPLLPHMLSITTANHILTTAVAIGQLVCLQGTEHNLLLQAIIGSTPLPSCTEGQLPKIIMWFRDISYLHLHTNSRGHREYKLTFRRITLILCYQVVTSSVSWQLVYKTEKNIMHLTPLKRVILIFLIQTQITQMIPAVTSSPLAFFFSTYISLRFHDLTERDIKWSLRT